MVIDTVIRNIALMTRCVLNFVVSLTFELKVKYINIFVTITFFLLMFYSVCF
jgi:hypothetical protein